MRSQLAPLRPKQIAYKCLIKLAYNVMTNVLSRKFATLCYVTLTGEVFTRLSISGAFLESTNKCRPDLQNISRFIITLYYVS